MPRSSTATDDILNICLFVYKIEHGIMPGCVRAKSLSDCCMAKIANGMEWNGTESKWCVRWICGCTVCVCMRFIENRNTNRNVETFWQQQEQQQRENKKLAQENNNEKCNSRSWLRTLLKKWFGRSCSFLNGIHCIRRGKCYRNSVTRLAGVCVRECAILPSVQVHATFWQQWRPFLF